MNGHRRFTLLFGAAAFVVALCSAEASSATTYDAAADFSIGSNPIGVWSYGYSGTVGGSFTLYTNSGNTVLGNPPDFTAWFATNSETTVNETPFAARNEAATTPTSGFVMPPGGLGLHPGPDANNEYSIVRWMAPDSGIYNVAAAFVDRNFTDPIFGPRGATTDVHVLLNDVSLYDAIIDRDGWGLGPPGFAAQLLLSSGDRIDFIVGRGENDTFISDVTGLEATLQFVPEPSTKTLIALGILGIIAYARRNSMRHNK